MNINSAVANNVCATPNCTAKIGILWTRIAVNVIESHDHIFADPITIGHFYAGYCCPVRNNL